jgi:anaerobic magnesium-protoporphyrin IX monomethyl ester cyclase
MKKKILFINAIDYGKKIEKLHPPLGLGYLASALRENFGQDHIHFKIIDREIEQTIQRFMPDLIGITAVTQNYNRAIAYARIAKKYGLPVIMGGVHISMLPSSLTSHMDVGVIGEGERTIVELFELFERKRHFDPHELKRIEGVAFRRDNEIVETDRRKAIVPLDKIPLPARDLFTIKTRVYMFTSRGCPYRCTFCASSRFWGRARFFSAEYVVSEIEMLAGQYGVKEIQFWDDLFIADRSRLKAIIAMLKKLQLKDTIEFTCNVRTNLVDDELVYLLKEMNVKSVGMGLESGAPASLRYLKGGEISPEKQEQAISILRRNGIEPHTSFIIGSPHETRKDILQTLSFIKGMGLTSFDTYVLTPFPGTPVWNYAKKRNLVSEDMDWDTFNINFNENCRKAIILSETLTREEIYRLFLMFRKQRLRLQIVNTLKHPLTVPKFFLQIVTKLLSERPILGRKGACLKEEFKKVIRN